MANSRTNLYDDILESFRQINQKSLDVVGNWRKGSRGVTTKTTYKGEETVTAADRLIEKEAVRLLHQRFPDWAVIAEESYQTFDAVNNLERYFAIDPIDGTRQFAEGTNQWAVSLAAVEDGDVAIGSIFMPDWHEQYTAVKGKGVEINGQKYHLSHPTTGIIAFSPRQANSLVFKKIMACADIKYELMRAFTPKIGAILRGDVDGAVFFPQADLPAAMWDYAASILLVKEAGGKITSFDGAELPLSGQVIHHGGWIAARDTRTYDRLVRLVSGHR